MISRIAAVIVGLAVLCAHGAASQTETVFIRPVLGAVTQLALRNALTALTNYADRKREVVAMLTQARNEYWACYDAGCGELDRLAPAYSVALLQKDLFFVEELHADAAAGAADGPFGNRLQNQLAAIRQLTGGAIDGGIPARCQEAWTKWASVVGAKGAENTVAEFSPYQSCRDREEFEGRPILPSAFGRSRNPRVRALMIMYFLQKSNTGRATDTLAAAERELAAYELKYGRERVHDVVSRVLGAPRGLYGQPNPGGNELLDPGGLGCNTGYQRYIHSCFQVLIGDTNLDGSRGSLAGQSAQTASPTPVGKSAAIRLTADMPKPTRIHDVAPISPSGAAQRPQGVVMVDVTIDPTGKVVEATVVRVVPGLSDAALAAARQWRFSQPLVDGAPATVILTLPVRFSN